MKGRLTCFTKYFTMFATKLREFSVWNVTAFLNPSPLFETINFQSKCSSCSFMQFHYLSHEAAKDSEVLVWFSLWLSESTSGISSKDYHNNMLSHAITAVLAEVIRCWSSYTSNNHRPLGLYNISSQHFRAIRYTAAKSVFLSILFFDNVIYCF